MKTAVCWPGCASVLDPGSCAPISRTNWNFSPGIARECRLIDSHNIRANPARLRWLEHYRFGLRVTEQGTIVAIGDGIARIKGLPSAAMEEILDFEEGSRAVVFALEPDNLSAILLAQGEKLTAGSVAYLSSQRLSIPVGDALLGRVVDPLGVPLDGGRCAGLHRPS